MRVSAGVAVRLARYWSFLRKAEFGRSSHLSISSKNSKPAFILIRHSRFAAIFLLLATTLLAAQSVTVSPTSLSFGSQAVSITSSAKTVTLKNGTSSTLTISSISTSGDYAETNTCGTSLAASTNCTINVTFTPSTTGSRTGTLSISDSASNSPQTVSLTGTGVLQATLSPASLSFGSQAIATPSASKTVTLKNNLPTALSISSINVTGDYAQTNNCGTSLATGASCTINVTFTPTTTGSRTGTLTVTDSASNSSQTASLTGTGILQATVSPASLSFGNQAVGTSSVAKTVTLINNLGAALSISSIGVSGDYGQTNTCGTSLATGANCTIRVTFTPTITGSRTGTLTLTDSASNSPQTVSLTGNGVVPVTVSPSSLAFGNQAITTTSSAKIVTVSNKQPTAVMITSITTPTVYAQSNTCGTLLAAQGTCTVSVTFSPTTTGSQPGTLTITDNASNSPQTVNLTGTGTALPTVTKLSVTSGAVGTSVIVTGTAFGGSQGSSTVTFNGSAASPTSWKSTSIVVTVPTVATTGNVVVTVNGGPSNGVMFTVVPNIASLSVGTGIAGTSVTITGTGFGGSQGSSTVTFNGTSTAPTNWSATSISAPVPAGATAGTGSVIVTVGGTASNAATFTVVPNIASLSATSGAIGSPITITGTGFGSSQGSSTVGFNGTSATPTNWSSGSITVPVPTGAMNGNVVVTVGGIGSSGIGFTVQSGGFVATTGQMTSAAYGHTATQLTTGQVLIAGGMSSSGVVSSTELYNPTNQIFAAASAMNVPRWLHTATLLNDGTVLIAGGSSLSSEATLNSAEIYNPVTGSFVLLPSTLNTARVGHTATLLGNGQVLIVGGYDPATGIIADSELYDPNAQIFIDLGNTNTPRFHHTATLLQNGQVLITGGETDPTPSGAYNTAELFNPQTWIFSPLSAAMVSGREGHAATVLNDGTVLITGGDLPGAGSLNTAEIYNPSSGAFNSVSAAMASPRIFHDANLLNGGKVLLSGGEDDSGGTSTPLNTAELYDPMAQTFTAVAGNMTRVRERHTSTLLNDGTVLEAGGTDGTNVFNTAEIYTTSKLTGLSSISLSPPSPNVPLGSQQLFTATGTFSGGGTQVLSSVLWSSSSTNVTTMSNDASDSGFASPSSQGTTAVTASAVGVSGSTTLSVVSAALVSITVNPPNATIPLGTTQQFAATGTYSDGSTQDLTSIATWTSSSSSATINSAGLATAAAVGNSTIRAGLGSQTGSATVSVSVPSLVSLTLTPTSATIAFGASQQYQVTGTYTDGSTQNLTNSVNWFSVPSTTASVSNGGLAVGLGQGNAVITASNGTLAATSLVTVQPPVTNSPTLVSVAVTPNPASIPVGSNQQFVATGFYSDGSTQDLTTSVAWASSSASVATVSNTGFAAAVGTGSGSITATSGTINGTATLSVQASTTALNTSRYEHSATLLDDGTVLIAGGINCPSAGPCSYLSSAEIYNPTSGIFTSTGSLSTARSAPAVLLGTGKILIAGGYACDSSGNCASLQSAELYDPVARTFSSAGSMTVSRSGQTMTMLGSGKVLVAAGENCTSSTSCTSLNSAEVYDPVAGTFAATGSLTAARFTASAVRLTSGKVLIAGGFDGTNYPAAAEIYDLVAGTFSTTGSLNTPRVSATATVLDNGSVLIAGGSTCGSPGCPTATTEEYTTNGYFSYTTYPTGNMTVARFDQTATLLTNGSVVLAGGYDSCATLCTSDSTTEIFNPYAGSFTTSQSLSTGRSGHTATLLTDGAVLLVGGINNGVTLSSTDSYQPASLAPTQVASIVITPANNPLSLGDTLALTATAYDAYTDNLGPLQSVIWNSSNPAVAGVSNAAGSAGIVNSLSVGTTTITASVGTISATAQITVTVPLVSITLSPSNTSAVLNSFTQPLQFTATGVYSDGSSKDLTSFASWSTSNSAVVKFLPNWPVTDPMPVVPAGVGSANVSATFDGISSSTTVTVTMPLTPAPPMVTGVSPAIGEVGTQVTISGSGFGTSQGSGIAWLGTTPASVVSWSDSQVVATVSAGSSSGVAEIQQGSPSNSVPFTVNTAALTGISPTSGLPGTQVTISGSGFGSAQGNGQVWLGTLPAVVNSWSDGQVVATVATGAASGSAQILQNGVMSNAVPFTINLPHISGITPNSGGAGTVITISGNGFGATQGSGNVWIGSTFGVVTGWSDSQIVASVASTAVTGVVKVEQSGIWSNATTFTVPVSFGGGTSVTIVPNVINLLAGGTQQLQALDSNGNSVPGLTWTSSNTAVATLSTDDPPILTAIAPGNTTIMVGTASADVTVFAGSTLPIGTVLWSNPGDGSGVSSIVPAVPSSTGVADVFSLQADGNVLAIKPDGTTAWTAQVGSSSTLIPDFQGGLVVYTGSSIYKLDGITGQPYQPYTSSAGLAIPVVHTDGTIFTVDGNSIVGIDPLTGQSKFSPVPMPSGSTNYIYGPPVEFCYDSPLHARAMNISGNSSSASSSPLMIAGDGYMYVSYYAINSTTTYHDFCVYEIQATSKFGLLRVGTAGDSYGIPLGNWTFSASYQQVLNGPNLYIQSGSIPCVIPGPILTNSDTGVIFTWELDTYSTGQCLPFGSPGGKTTTFNVATTAGSGLASQNQVTSVPGQATALQPVLQRQDGNFVGTVGTGPQPGQVTQTNLIAFDPSGKSLFTTPNLTPQIATSDNGTVAGSSSGQYVQLDQIGNVKSQLPCSNPIVSWTNKVYQMQPVLQVSCTTPPPASPPNSNFAGANPSGTATSAICRNDSLKGLVVEYTTFKEAFSPTCTEFTSSSDPKPATDFSFNELNVSDIDPNHTDHPDFGLFMQSLLSGLESMRANYNNQPLTINSGYRSPYVQNIVNPGVLNDSHIYGLAADISTGRSEPVWNNMRVAAKSAGACVEPWQEQDDLYHHIHVEWTGAACKFSQKWGSW